MLFFIMADTGSFDPQFFMDKLRLIVLVKNLSLQENVLCSGFKKKCYNFIKNPQTIDYLQKLIDKDYKTFLEHFVDLIL